jgi:hypothetical protein
MKIALAILWVAVVVLSGHGYLIDHVARRLPARSDVPRRRP